MDGCRMDGLRGTSSSSIRHPPIVASRSSWHSKGSWYPSVIITMTIHYSPIDTCNIFAAEQEHILFSMAWPFNLYCFCNLSTAWILNFTDISDVKLTLQWHTLLYGNKCMQRYHISSFNSLVSINSMPYWTPSWQWLLVVHSVFLPCFLLCFMPWLTPSVPWSLYGDHL